MFGHGCKPLGLLVILLVVLSYSRVNGENTETYLGKKIRAVIKDGNVSYLEKKGPKFIKKHRRVLVKLLGHLSKEYPDLEKDFSQLLRDNYSSDFAECDEGKESRTLNLESLIGLLKKHSDFRTSLLKFIDDKYPSILGEIGCYLRDEDAGALGEILRITIRMTSNVGTSVLKASVAPSG